MKHKCNISIITCLLLALFASCGMAELLDSEVISTVETRFLEENADYVKVDVTVGKRTQNAEDKTEEIWGQIEAESESAIFSCEYYAKFIYEDGVWEQKQIRFGDATIELVDGSQADEFAGADDSAVQENAEEVSAQEDLIPQETDFIENTSTPAISESPTPIPTATSTPTPTLTPSPSPSLMPTPTPTPEPTPAENTTVLYTVYIANVPYAAYLRAEPSESGTVLAEVPARTAVGVVELSNGSFTKVSYNGMFGYVKSEYLSDSIEEGYETWTITKHNTGTFESYREITYTLEWEPGMAHALLSKWDTSDENYMMILYYEVDFDNRKVILCMDHFEGDSGYTKLVVDLSSNTSWLENLYDSTNASFVSS